LGVNGWEAPLSNKNSSQKPSPRGSNIIYNHKASFNQGSNVIENIMLNDSKLPNLRTKGANAVGEKSLERTNANVISRKELIKKEYNRILETKLPNILNMMNH
jgi:hypothetical protein